MNKKLWIPVVVFTTCVLLALVWLKLPLWRDIIIRSDSGGTFVTASGDEYPTNRWFSKDERWRLAMLQDSRGGVIIHYLVENYDENEKAKLRVGDYEYYAILDNLKFSSKTGRLEYIVRPGPEAK